MFRRGPESAGQSPLQAARSVYGIRITAQRTDGVWDDTRRLANDRSNGNLCFGSSIGMMEDYEALRELVRGTEVAGVELSA
ncbi:hypothetical protein POX_c04642 [Penicillium oxalicum]|uniref:hypothetical protein n=1 Tax=Penicillium oxalicum TaxID=69781 RepID=UPI0020B6BE6D|nr:hypothetical protein POX_c04642 [Penicillium oxalicum]KAI2791764.1 hypothetical protein POX_c04642 [Penicillium oxalicum]